MNRQTQTAADQSAQPSLLRVLGPGAALAAVVGNVIGSGIFLKPGIIAAQAGDFSLILAAWVIGGLVCLLGALCFAELAVTLPQAGGVYVYLREAYGRPVAFLFGWNEFLFNRPGSIGALSMAFIGAMSNAINSGTYFEVRLISPLMWMTKGQIVKLGEHLAVPFDLTYSCYEGKDDHCGLCSTCISRKVAFEKSGVHDPTRYMH